MVRSAAVVFVALVASCSVATAQELRQPVAGRVQDGAGEPVVGATVVLCGAVEAPAWDVPPDVVQVSSDERGRFRAQVRECIEYSAFAVGPGTGAARRVSGLQDGVVPGPRLDLVVDRVPLAELEVTGLAPFAGRAPLQARLWLEGGAGYSVQVPVGAERITFPELWPRANCKVELVGSDGRSICILRPADEALEVPAPREVDVIVEGENGEPIADAEIYSEHRIYSRLAVIGGTARDRRLVLGKSGADGRARVSVVSHGAPDLDRSDIVLRAHKPGFVDGFAGWTRNGVAFGDALHGAEAIGEHGLRLRLAKGDAKPGRVRIGDRAIPDCEVIVRTLRYVQTGTGVGYGASSQQRATSDKTGAFTIMDLPRGSEIEQVMLRGVAVTEHIGDPTRAMPPGQPLLPLPTGDAFDCDLAALTRVSLQVLQPDGGPASAAVLLLMPLGAEGRYPAANDPRYRLDRAGRTTLILQAGVWFVMALDGQRAVWQRLEVGGERQDVALRLGELPRLHGLALDGNGKPVAGAELRWSGYSYRKAKTPFGDQLRAVAVLLYQRWIPMVKSDAEGRFQMPMFPDDKTDFTVLLGKGERTSDAWQLRFESDPIERVVR